MLRDIFLVLNRMAVGHILVAEKHSDETKYLLMGKATSEVAPFVVAEMSKKDLITIPKDNGKTIFYEINYNKAFLYVRQQQMVRDTMMLYLSTHIDKVVDETVERSDCESDSDYENVKATLRVDILEQCRFLAEFYQD